MNVLITGSAGRIGSAAAEALRRAGHFVRGFDRANSPAANESVIGDLTDLPSVTAAAKGAEALIHMAATPDDADFMTSLLGPNIVGVHHILEAARANNIKRVALASSGQVNWYAHITGPYPIRVTDPISPRYWYAVTKIFAEGAGQVYATSHGMDIVALRLGACPRDRELVDFIAARETSQDVYLSPADAGRFFVKFVEAPSGFGFQVIFLASKWLKRQVFDMEPAKRIFGFEPQDRWPQGLPIELLKAASP